MTYVKQEGFLNQLPRLLDLTDVKAADCRSDKNPRTCIQSLSQGKATSRG